MATALYADGSTPILTADPNSSLTNLEVNGNTWIDKEQNNKLIWNLNSNIYTIQSQQGNAAKVTPLKFNIRFANSDSDTNTNLRDGQIEIFGTDRDGVGLPIKSTISSLTLDFEGKGLKLGTDTTKGMATLHFENSSTSFTVKNLASLDANLLLYGDPSNTTANTHYTINLGSMNGDILLQGQLSSTQGDITFNGSGLTGNISAAETVDASTTGVININFQNGSTMTGYIRGHGVGYDSLKRIVNFNGGSGKTVLTGNVFSYGTSLGTAMLNKSAGNYITFNQGNMEGSIIATVGNGLTSKKGYNNITFNSGGVQKLVGGLLANDNNQQSTDTQATNTLTIGKDTILQIIAGSNNQIKQTAENSTKQQDQDKEVIGTTTNTFDLTTGSIIARGWGINEINLDTNSTLILNNGEGEIKTENTGGTGAKSKITFTGANGTIQGKITTTTGSSTITVNSSASGTIAGSLLTTAPTSSPIRETDTEARAGNGNNNIILGTSANITTYDASADATPTTPATASLTLQGENNTISTLTVKASDSTLSVDGSRNTNTTTINATTIETNANLTLNLNGRGESNGATAKLINNSSELTLKALTLGNGSTHNTLDLTQRNAKTTITEKISVSNGQGVTIKLQGQELALTGGMNTTGGTSTLRIEGNGSTATLSGADAVLTNLDLDRKSVV